MMLFGLIGDPVKHSLSPLMQNRALEVSGLNGSYIKKRVGADDLERCLMGAELFGFDGLNVTIPHKERVFGLCDWLGWGAELAESVNTIKFVDGCLRGYNTDVVGVRNVVEREMDLDDCVVSVAGAGGAAKGVCVGLRGARKINIANRTKKRAQRLAQALEEKIDVEVEAFGLDDLGGLVGESDLFVNATSVGMEEDDSILDIEDLVGDLVVFDLVYKPVETKLLRLANQSGCKTINGLEMLVEQGAASFETWTGENAPKEEMMKVLKKERGQR